MAGLLGSSQQPPAAAPASSQPAGAAPAPAEITSAAQAGADSLDDPVLKQAEQGIEQSVPDEYRKMYESTVVAGMNVMFSKETASLMEQQLDEGGDLADNVSSGVAKLIMIVFNEITQSMDPQKLQAFKDQFTPASVLAAVTLMCQALDFAEQTRGAKVTPEVVATCTKQTQMKVLKSFGISEDQINQVAQAGIQSQAGGAAPQPQGA